MPFYVTQQRRNGDRHLYAARTRFIPREILEHFERVHRAPALPQAAPAPGSVDVSARLRAMWG